MATPMAALPSAKSPLIRSNSSWPIAFRLQQVLGAAVVGRQAGQAGLALLERGLRPVELGLVGPGVDLEEQGALLDLVAVVEVDLVEVAGHPRPDLDREDGLGVADESS